VGVASSSSLIFIRVLAHRPCGWLQLLNSLHLQTLFFSDGSLTGFELLGLSWELEALLQCRQLVVSSHQPSVAGTM
jgi:hypothetical protein